MPKRTRKQYVFNGNRPHNRQLPRRQTLVRRLHIVRLAHNPIKTSHANPPACRRPLLANYPFEPARPAVRAYNLSRYLPRNGPSCRPGAPAGRVGRSTPLNEGRLASRLRVRSYGVSRSVPRKTTSWSPRMRSSSSFHENPSRSNLIHVVNPSLTKYQGCITVAKWLLSRTLSGLKHYPAASCAHTSDRIAGSFLSAALQCSFQSGCGPGCCAARRRLAVAGAGMQMQVRFAAQWREGARGAREGRRPGGFLHGVAMDIT